LLENYFRKESDRINADFEDIVASVYIWEPEKLEDGVSGYIGIDVLFQIVAEDNSDNLFLQIDVVERQDIEISVRAAWGYPSGEIVELMFDEPILVNETNLKLAQTRMPEMIERLRQEIRENPRGK
jgi:hypothetical protein